MGAGYRLQQLWRNITSGPLSEPANAEVSRVLSQPERELFDRFESTDQRHSYRVYRALVEAQPEAVDLHVAALLHDVGKTRAPLAAVHRALVVVVQKFWPERARQWGSGPAESWRWPFVVRQHHAEWGAQMAEAAGSSPGVVALIRYHQDKQMADDKLVDAAQLRLLQWADDRN